MGNERIDDRDLDDRELDTLLASATAPKLSPDFARRLENRLGLETQQMPSRGEVIAFPQRPAAAANMRLLKLFPLAAALAGGIYLGAATSAPDLFTTDGYYSAAYDNVDPLGLDSLFAMEQDGQS